MQYKEIEKYLMDVPKFTTKNKLKDTEIFMEALGNPGNKSSIIHVAGTNGKGSVCAYLSSILKEAGYQTAMFTSPHLIEMRERFRINGRMVEQALIKSGFERVMETLPEVRKKIKNKNYHPTFFELLFLIGMVIFEEVGVEFIVLETGLGGRLDATNVVKNKTISVITEIGMDHMEYLGDSIPSIATEKAGIIQKGVPVVYCDKRKKASEVICKQADLLGSETFSVGQEDITFHNFNNKTIDFSLRTRYYDYIRLTLVTHARYQMENAALAVRTIEAMDKGRIITAEQIMNGIKKTVWEGRMEELLPGVYVDGAHNEDGVEAFLLTVGSDNCGGKRYVVFGVSADKQYQSMIHKLTENSLFAEIAAAGFSNDRTALVSDLKEVFKAYTDKTCIFFEKAAEAVAYFRQKKRDEDYIYIVGSLYLVGEIKALLRRRTDD